MLASFLFTPKQQRLLAAVLLQPEREYTLASLREATSGGVSSLLAFVNTLLDAGVLQVRMERASKMYRANVDHPLYPELKSIAVKSFGVAEPIRRALEPLKKKIVRAFIFGSLVNGTQTHASDVDLMVIGAVSAGQLRLALNTAEQAVGRPIHVNAYGSDEFDLLQQSDPVIKSILEGAAIELHHQTSADSSNDSPNHQFGQHAGRMASSAAVPKKRRNVLHPYLQTNRR